MEQLITEDDLRRGASVTEGVGLVVYFVGAVVENQQNQHLQKNRGKGPSYC